MGLEVELEHGTIGPNTNDWILFCGKSRPEMHFKRFTFDEILESLLEFG
jgi:hypothetical protein